MEGIKRRLDRNGYLVSINNVYKMIPFRVPDNTDGTTGRILEKVNPFLYTDSTNGATANKIRINEGSIFMMKNPNVSEVDNENPDIIVVEIETANKTGFIIEPSSYYGDLSFQLDGSTYKQGKDYYIYLVYDDSESTEQDKLKILISTRSDKPIKAENTYYDYNLKIGGFHVGTIRETTPGKGPAKVGGIPLGSDHETEFGSGWKSNVHHECIIHNSIWDLGFKPNSQPEGLAYTRAGLWEGIYQLVDKDTKAGTTAIQRYTSGVGKYAKSSGPNPGFKYGYKPISGSNGLNAVTATMLARQMKGMFRLPTYHEWIAGSFGSPQGVASNLNYGYYGKSAKAYTGCAVNESTGEYDSSSGICKYAVSADNLSQCVGNVHEIVRDITFDTDGGKGTGAGGSWTWLNLTGSIEGDFYGGVKSAVCGGSYEDTANKCGGFALKGDHSALDTSATLGCRFVVESACLTDDINSWEDEE